MKNWIWFFVWSIVISASSCGQKVIVSQSDDFKRVKTSEISMAPDQDGWIALFDGKSTAGWRTYGKKSIGKSWVVKDGILTLSVIPTRGGKTRAKDGGDIITTQEFENFELSIEWKISPCGNSGIMFGVSEDKSFEKTYHTGPEMQVLDNSCHPDAKIHTHRAGDLYDMIACSTEVVKPAGEWNKAQIMINDGHTIFTLNDEKVVEFTMFGEEWDEMIAKSKFKDMPGFGKFRRGHIALQDHGDEVSFRNIKIRVL